MSAQFSVLATCGTFEPGFRGGGHVRSVANIVDTVSDHIDVTLVTRDRDLNETAPYRGLSGCWAARDRAKVYYLGITNPLHWWRLWRAIRRVRFDLLYVNSLWSPFFSVIPIVAVHIGVIHAKSVLIAPRGEFSPAALSLKARKKLLFLPRWERVLRTMNLVWHASSPKEKSDILARFPWAQVDVVENQVALPPEPLAPIPHEGHLRLVFIGRIAPMKNLGAVLEALRHVTRPVDLDVYGPLEDAHYWTRCRSLIDQLPDAVQVRYLGELRPENVRSTFAAYDAFAFPTLGENFGHVIAESLSASCPVICSDRTPWSPVLAAGGGSVLSDITGTILRAEIIRRAGATPAERLAARRAAGDAYREWRRSTYPSNVLEVARLRRTASDKVGWQ